MSKATPAEKDVRDGNCVALGKIRLDGFLAAPFEISERKKTREAPEFPPPPYRQLCRLPKFRTCSSASNQLGLFGILWLNGKSKANG